ncbi:hypothetical protein Sano_18 [Xylella phage Sano]|uniref:Uncharacterized protein n=1 Tax=Xylella phage Sano TaxID=1415148 RepID=V5Q7H8_9CAUD|nr:hypothetical protein FGG50_gp18 [Xylella phage Sano]AHB12038.1 hypothetical protein Sano_18 [Xylella phage Sano]
MSFRPSTGRKITVKKNPKTTRDIMRRHLREEGKRIVDLCDVWDMHPNSAYRRFYDKRPMTPQMIDAFVTLLKLDHEDASELRLFAAIEAGWQLDHLKEKAA